MASGDLSVVANLKGRRVMTIGYSIHVFLEKGCLSDNNENYIILYSSFVNL